MCEEDPATTGSSHHDPTIMSSCQLGTNNKMTIAPVHSLLPYPSFKQLTAE